MRLTVPREKAESSWRIRFTVLLVDDHALVRRGFRRMLEDELDITVAGEASDSEEAVRLARTAAPKSDRHGLCAARHERAGGDAQNPRSTRAARRY